MYFLWNLFLISSRLTALALFASVLPCFIFTHFFCSWLVLFFFAWRSKTKLMDSPGGEWLYRATVGLIWYFDWFNVVEGKTRNRSLLYHGYILADISLLCGLWYWKICTEPPYFEIPHSYAVITAVSVAGVYIVGLLFKIIYYKYYHPNLAKEELIGGTSGQGPTSSEGLSRPEDPAVSSIMNADTDVTDRSWPSPPSSGLKFFGQAAGATDADTVDGIPLAPAAKHCNKRMRKLAENFYSWSAVLAINRICKFKTNWVMESTCQSMCLINQDHGAVWDWGLWPAPWSIHLTTEVCRFLISAHCSLY